MIKRWALPFFLTATLSTPTEGARQISVTIGTGDTQGIYYAVGGSICRAVNAESPRHNIRCSIAASGGSAANVAALRAKEVDAAIVQSDVAFGETQTKLQGLASLYSETLTLLARTESGISRWADIRGKKVNIGNPGSGQRETSLEFLKACAIQEGEIGLAGTMKVTEMLAALGDGRLDAAFYVVGHPAENVAALAEKTSLRMIPMEGSCVDRMIEKDPYLIREMIPAGLYRGVDKKVPTFATRAILAATSELDPSIAYEIARAIGEHLDILTSSHRVLAPLTLKSLASGIPIPLHPGANRYFSEK